MFRTTRATSRLFVAAAVCCLICSAGFAEDISLVSYNIRHFQGYSPGRTPDWSRWADTEWYPNPSKPGFYNFYAGLLESLDADIIALQGSCVPDHDKPDDAAGGHGEMDIVPQLAERLGMDCYVQERTRFHGFAFLSRLPIVDSADYTHQGSPGTGLVRITVQTEDGGNLHVYSTYLHWRDPEIRRRELDFNRRIIEEQGLEPHVYVGDWQLGGIGNAELDPVREAGYEGYGHGSQGIWVPADGEAEVIGFAPVENEWTSAALTPNETVGCTQLPFKAVVRARGPFVLPEERRAAMLRALNLTEESLHNVEAVVSAETRPVHAADILRQMPVEENEYRRMSLVPVARPEFQLALRIETKEKPENPWDVSVGARNVRPIAAGDALVASFWVRAIPVEGGGVPGRMTFRVQETRPPWRGPTVEFRDLGEEWRFQRLAFTMPDNYGPDGAEIKFHCGHARQTLELGGLQVVNCRARVPLSDLVAWSHYEQYLQDCSAEQ
jgi:hypothetical protein